MDRAKLEKIVGLLGSNYEGEPDGVAISALRKIQQIAAEEKKSLAALLMSGGERIVYQEKVVYRDRPAGPGQQAYQNMYEEMQRQQRERAEQRARDRTARNEDFAKKAKERYSGAFDDAEMSDADRDAARAQRRKGGRGKRGFAGDRSLLDDLAEALKLNDDDLSGWEIEFAQNVPWQYSYDWELSENQRDAAERIVRKVRRNAKGSPI